MPRASPPAFVSSSVSSLFSCSACFCWPCARLLLALELHLLRLQLRRLRLEVRGLRLEVRGLDLQVGRLLEERLLLLHEARRRRSRALPPARPARSRGWRR